MHDLARIVDLEFNRTMSEFPVYCQTRRDAVVMPFMHAHEGYEFHFSCTSVGVCRADDREYAFHPGKLTIIRPGTYHWISTTQSSEYVRIILSIQASYIEALAALAPVVTELLESWFGSGEGVGGGANAGADAVSGAGTGAEADAGSRSATGAIANADAASVAAPSTGAGARSAIVADTGPGLAQVQLAAKEEAEAVRQLLQSIERELEQRKPNYSLLVKAKLLELFVLLGRHTDETDGGEALSAANRRMMDEAADWLTAHCERQVSMTELAAAHHISKSQLFKLFKRHTGYSPHQFQTLQRINRAKALLSGTDESITEIALSVGFGEAAHFSRSFKEMTGVTPGFYRSSMRD